MKLLTLVQAISTPTRARFSLRALQLAGVLLVLTGVIAVAGRADALEPNALDKYPGLGRSPAGALRDDTIAVWEAFRREQAIASCLGRAGFTYMPSVAYPSEPLAGVAQSLGISPSSAAGPTPRQQNAAYEATLSGDTRERYFQALYGESVADITSMRSTGQVPPTGGSDFAQRGCVGEANAAVPSVWSLKRGLDAELQALRKEIATAVETGASGDAFLACAQSAGSINARGPAAVERIAVTGSHADEVGAVAKQCTQIWATGYRKVELGASRSFEQRNIAILQAAADRYRDVMATISADTAFRAYLAQWGRS